MEGEEKCYQAPTAGPLGQAQSRSLRGPLRPHFPLLFNRNNEDPQSLVAAGPSIRPVQIRHRVVGSLPAMMKWDLMLFTRVIPWSQMRLATGGVGPSFKAPLTGFSWNGQAPGWASILQLRSSSPLLWVPQCGGGGLDLECCFCLTTRQWSRRCRRGWSGTHC